jgi:hypothetical protein
MSEAASAAALLPAIRWTAWAAFLVLWGRLAARDWKEQKILHRDLRLGALFALACYLLLFGSTLLGALGRAGVFYSWEFYRDFLWHLAATTVAGLGLWRARIWPAGDAKLFLFLGAVIPLLSISGSFQGGWLFLSALINIFLPACAWVFLSVLRYLWLSRFQHQSGFLKQLGLRRGFDFAVDSAKKIAGESWGRFVADLRWAVEKPKDLFWGVLGWAFSMFLMALLSVGLKGIVDAPAARTGICFLFLFVWQRAHAALGKWATPAVATLCLSVGWAGAGPEFSSELAKAVGALSVFGVFLWLGMRWTLGVMAGELGMYVMPVVGMFLGFLTMAFWKLWSGLAWASGLLPLALLGLFFGLCYVFVRVWEDEDHPDVPAESLLSYMVVHPRFLERLEKEDKRFYQKHFEDNYADGLTFEQVEALRKWCKRKNVATVPLNHTMSFAHWIFLGYFITWLMGGNVLNRALALL